VKLPRTDRLDQVQRVAQFVPFVRVVRGEYDSRQGNAVLVQDEGKQIVAVPFLLERESSLSSLVRDFCPVLRSALFLSHLDNNFLRVEGRATLVSKLYDDVVI